MSAVTDNLYSKIGRRVAERRKLQGLSQTVLASRLSRKRTQTWVSTVESGRRNVNANDLFEIAAILEITVGELFSEPSRSPSSPSTSLHELLDEIGVRLPIEMPVYLQRDMGKPDIAPIDYHYTSTVPSRSVFSSAHPQVHSRDLNMMVVERYYRQPRMDPSDLLTYNVAAMPTFDSSVRAPDRILIKLNEPLADLDVHPGLIKSSNEVEIALSRHQTVVFSKDAYEIIGVVTVRRTLYRSSIIRAWLQRQYGIIKDERLSE